MSAPIKSLVFAHDFVPVRWAYLRFVPPAQDLFGKFDPSTKSERLRLTRHLRDQIFPHLLSENADLVRKPLQFYDSGRTCRDLLWDSERDRFPASKLAEVLVSQWSHAAGRNLEDCVLRASRLKHLRDISDQWHSEVLTARLWLFQRTEWLRSVIEEDEAKTLRPIDSTRPPFDSTTAAFEYRKSSGNKKAIVFPVAKQWRDDEQGRLTSYLLELHNYFQEFGYEYEIHSPRIGTKALWLSSQ